jgi:cation:H+ antiporter
MPGVTAAIVLLRSCSAKPLYVRHSSTGVARLRGVVATAGEDILAGSPIRKDLLLPVYLEFAVALGAIVVAAAIFTNAIEILGGRLSLGQGAVGSVLAAVGTALPETMIPVVAILAAVFAGRDPETAGEIGIGAILGAPFMLATLAMFVVGASALYYRNRRVSGAEVRCEGVAADDFPWCKAPGKSVNIDADTISRDLAFFLIFFAVAAAVGVVELLYPLKIVLALLLVVAYALYVRRTLHSGEALEEVPDRLTLWRRSSAPPTWAVVGQALLALALIVVGAQIFVDAVEHTAESVGLPAGLVALVLAPLATELPEKINSVIWIRDGKDTLALGNITGAMVFQSTVPVTFGVLFTRWELEPLNLFSVVLALVSGVLIYVALRRSKTLQSWQLMLGGIFYLAFLTGAVIAVF